MKKLSINWLLSAVIISILSSSAFATDYRVSVYKKDRVFLGTTIFADTTNRSRQKIVEVDFNGKIRWQYQLPKRMQGGRSLLLEATPLVNGNILFTVRGHGIYEVSRKKKLVWSHRDPAASHDADRLDNGNTLYNRGWAKKGGDHVIEISPKGKRVWSWNGMKEYGSGFFSDFEVEGWMHVNAVTRLGNGNTLISIRNFNKVVEVDPSGSVVWDMSFRGLFRKGRDKVKPTDGPIRGITNHEPEITPQNTLLVALRKPWRFAEIDRQSKQIIWQWFHPEGRQALLVNRDANRLPNGNTLVTSANRIIEIAPDGEIVWQLHAPRVSAKKNGRKSSRKGNGRGQGQRRDNRVGGGGQNVVKQFHKVIRLSADGSIYGG